MFPPLAGVRMNSRAYCAPEGAVLRSEYWANERPSVVSEFPVVPERRPLAPYQTTWSLGVP